MNPTRRTVLLGATASIAGTILAAQEKLEPARKAKALFFDHADKWTSAIGAEERLAGAGFVVEKLPLDRPPAELDAEVIFLASFVSERPDYRAYVKKYAKELQRFVEKGRVLVQMAQADQTESVPPFLPATLKCRRVDADFEQAYVVSAESPLLKDVPTSNLTVRFARADKRTIWESLTEQSGFEVLVAAERESAYPGLMVGGHGKGRIILAAMDFDKQTRASREKYSSAAQDAFAGAFFRNLHGYALAVAEGNAPAVAVTPPALPVEEFVAGSWTLAVMPDTQVYARLYPGLFISQAEWIARNKEKYNIQYALHLGDITDHNTVKQWENARNAMNMLLGKVPVALVTGNHDHGPNGNAASRDTFLNEYLPPAKWGKQTTVGGMMDENDSNNTFHLFSAGGVDWIIIALEWAPRDETVAWADQVMARHPNRRGMLITHAYMNHNDRRYDINEKQHTQTWNPHLYKTPGTKNDGEQLWNKLVRKHDFALTLNGHVLVDGTGYLASRNDRGRTCHQMLSNYQFRALGGEGYLRLLEFRPDGKTVQVKTYSALYDKYLLVPDQQFALVLD